MSRAIVVDIGVFDFISIKNIYTARADIYRTNMNITIIMNKHWFVPLHRFVFCRNVLLANNCCNWFAGIKDVVKLDYWNFQEGYMTDLKCLNEYMSIFSMIFLMSFPALPAGECRPLSPFLQLRRRLGDLVASSKFHD